MLRKNINPKLFKYIISSFPLKLIACLINILLMGISCENDSNLVVPESDPSLVLFSILCPADTVVKVKLYYTNNRFGKPKSSDSYIEDVFFIDDSLEYQMNFDDYENCSLKYQVQAGHTYRIRVTSTDSPELSATCTLPEPLEPKILIQLDTIKSEGYMHYWNISFKDWPDSRSYFIANIYNQRFPKEAGSRLDPFYDENADQFNGYCFKDPGYIINGYSYFDNASTDSVIVKAYLLEFEENYYKYYNSLLNYSGTEDPFTEFSPIYTNIKNGYGIFGGCNKYLSTKTIK